MSKTSEEPTYAHEILEGAIRDLKGFKATLFLISGCDWLEGATADAVEFLTFGLEDLIAKFEEADGIVAELEYPAKKARIDDRLAERGISCIQAQEVGL